MKKICLLCLILILLLAMPALSQTKSVRVVDRRTGKAQVITPYENSYAVCIGINKYTRNPQLNYAVADAKAMQKAFIKMGFDEVKLVTDAEATKEGILSAIAWLVKISVEQDRVVIYFSGHGQTQKGRGKKPLGYIIPVNCPKEGYYENAISMGKLKEATYEIKAKHILYLVDSCYSGTGILTKRANTEFMFEMAQDSCVFIITAGKAGEEVREMNGHGIFTNYILKGLNGKSDYDTNGVITGSELGLYVKTEVYNRTKQLRIKQTPQFGSIEGEGEVVFATLGQSIKKPSIAPNDSTETVRADTAIITPEEPGIGMLYVQEQREITAEVFVDGKKVGMTPHTNTEIPTGRHKVTIKKALYHDYSKVVTIGKDRIERIATTLQPAFGSLNVTATKPQNAAIELLDISGLQIGKGVGPFKIEQIPSGSYSLRATKKKHYPQTQDVTIQDGEETDVSITLTPKFGTLVVESTPKGAIVILDSVEKGTTPLTLKGLDSGKYWVEVKKELYTEWNNTVEIKDGKTTNIFPVIASNFGTLDVSVTPSGASIIVDGTKVGETPSKLKLTPGTCMVTVKHDHYIPIKREVIVKKDTTVAMPGKLKQKMGSLRVTSIPPGAIIAINGTGYGYTPQTISFPTGPLTFHLSKIGFSKYQESTNIEWNTTLERSVTLKLPQERKMTTGQMDEDNHQSAQTILIIVIIVVIILCLITSDKNKKT